MNMINVVETGVIFIILFPLLQVNQLTNNPVYGMDEVLLSRALYCAETAIQKKTIYFYGHELR